MNKIVYLLLFFAFIFTIVHIIAFFLIIIEWQQGWTEASVVGISMSLIAGASFALTDFPYRRYYIANAGRERMLWNIAIVLHFLLWIALSIYISHFRYTYVIVGIYVAEGLYLIYINRPEFTE